MPPPDRAGEQATLVTRRLLVVPLADRHLVFQQELEADPEGIRLLYPRPPTPEEVVVSHGRRMALGRGEGGLGIWVGVAAEPDGSGSAPPGTEADGHPVALLMLVRGSAGTGRLSAAVPGERVAETGMQLRPEAWGRGLAGEAVTALVEHGMRDLGLDRVVAGTMAVNAASRRVLEKAGLEPTGPGDERPGAEQGEVVYAVTRARWLEGRGRPAADLS